MDLKVNLGKTEILVSMGITKDGMPKGPNGHASLRPDHLPTLLTAKTSKLSLLVKSPLVAERSMPALLLRLLLQCAGNIEMNP